MARTPVVLRFGYAEKANGKMEHNTSFDLQNRALRTQFDTASWMALVEETDETQKRRP
jgi:hypothetical protein